MSDWRLALAALVLCLVWSGCVTTSLDAQGPAPSGWPVIALEPGSRTLNPAPPFDQIFLLKAPKVGTSCARRVLVGLATPPLEEGVTFAGSPQVVPLREGVGKLCESDSHFLIAPLLPNRRYLIRIEYQADANVAQQLDVITSPRADLTAHFDADLGAIWAPRPGPALVAMSSNMHFYVVPINKNESLTNRSDSMKDQVFKRLSIFVGFSAVRLRTGSPVENRVSSGNVVLGIGIKPRFAGAARRFDFFRLNVGLLFYAQKDPNPIVATQHPKKAPFIGLTGDLELEKVLGPIGALLGLKK